MHKDGRRVVVGVLIPTGEVEGMTGHVWGGWAQCGEGGHSVGRVGTEWERRRARNGETGSLVGHSNQRRATHNSIVCHGSQHNYGRIMGG